MVNHIEILSRSSQNPLQNHYGELRSDFGKDLKRISIANRIQILSNPLQNHYGELRRDFGEDLKRIWKGFGRISVCFTTPHHTTPQGGAGDTYPFLHFRKLSVRFP